MRKLNVLFVIVFALQGNLFAQLPSSEVKTDKNPISKKSIFFDLQKFEVGINVGFSSYMGDLKPQKYSWKQSSLAEGIQIRKKINNRFAFSASLNNGELKGDDALSSNSELVKRNLSFKSNLIEFGIVGETYFPIKQKKGSTNEIKKYYKAIPYIFAGVNVFHFNPKAYYNGSWIALQPLHTEGQGLAGNKKIYNRTQIAIPVGIGVNYVVNPRISVSFEFGIRKTFTDYIDDVSTSYPDLNLIAQQYGQTAANLSYRTDELPGKSTSTPTIGQNRGNPKNNDWYLMNVFTLRYKLKK